MFILKKIISGFLFPLPLSLLVSFTGLYILWFTARQKSGKILVSTGLIMLTLFSYSAVADRLLKPLERQYNPLETQSVSTIPETESGIRFIVVLGGGHITDPELPSISQISSHSLVRLVEGIRIHRRHPEAKLLLSGGNVFDPVPEAVTMARVAEEMGVSENDIMLETRSKDTKDQAQFIKSIVGGERFILVTSASHMPRSMAMFRKLGMNPVPSSTGHRVKGRHGITPYSFFPSLGNLEKSETAIYEYLGLTWSKIRGQR